MGMYTGIECSIDDCTKQAYAKYWCKTHYERSLKYGDPLGGGVIKGEPVRFYLATVQLDTDECILWPYGKDTIGYGVIFWEGKGRKVHRIACEQAYGPPPEPEMDAAHGPCNNRLCFNPKHLSWKTRKDNVHDRFRDGTMLLGEQVNTSKLTESQVLEIRLRYKTGAISYRDLASEYGVKHNAIGRILREETWKHLV